MMTVRPATPDDAGALLALKTTLDNETSLMMLEPGERATTVDDERVALEALSRRANSVLLIAEEEGELAGYLQADGGEFRRNRHSAQIVVGVRQAFAGRGIGTRLFEELERWAGERGVHRLELTVQAHNQPAIALYRKMGFSVEGTRRHSLFVDGGWVDELLMAKLISGATGQPPAEPV